MSTPIFYDEEARVHMYLDPFWIEYNLARNIMARCDIALFRENDNDLLLKFNQEKPWFNGEDGDFTAVIDVGNFSEVGSISGVRETLLGEEVLLYRDLVGALHGLYRKGSLIEHPTTSEGRPIFGMGKRQRMETEAKIDQLRQSECPDWILWDKPEGMTSREISNMIEADDDPATK